MKRCVSAATANFATSCSNPHPRFNILVGENEAGKSTLLEAIGLALTGRVNGRAAAEELNPFWFNQENVGEFFRDRQSGKPVAPPEIRIEIFLEDREEFQRSLFGARTTQIRRCGLRSTEGR
ncbi:AAA family ATPase [Rhodococcus wratislaviensis]|uniref:Rad50/SbcC-type AAA domain-containing protein n=1 Tax=Rhodococcus wratislaviensis NBRC 100605 TaxID=1219028 RepID=X0PTT7_RHOWR|nr:ATP-binding protein [Rhodococcus wratislaviensis]GAF46483.1 hypothetical protein RW1_031_00670 [Rhodococcus wratislaviensis NBRC 100605]